MDDVVISLKVYELDTLKLLVKESIAVCQVRIDSACTEIAREHERFSLEYLKSILKSLVD